MSCLDALNLEETSKARVAVSLACLDALNPRQSRGARVAGATHAEGTSA
jgi:hypothetical protein